MNAIQATYALIIGLNIFQINLCNFDCQLFPKNTTTFHTDRGSFVDLNFSIPESCYDKNDPIVITSLMVFNITVSLNELYCQVIHEDRGLCILPSVYQNCSCMTINSTDFYWVRIWVAGYGQEKYRLEITFEDEGTRFARGDVTVTAIDSFGGHFHQLNSSGDSSNAEPDSETKNNLPSDTTRDGVNSSVSNDEHDNSSVTAAVVIVVVVVVKTAFIIAVIVVRRRRRSAMRAPVAPRVGDDQQLRRIPEVNNRRMSQQSDQDCQDYDPLDPDYEPVERYTAAYQGHLTRPRKETAAPVVYHVDDYGNVNDIYEI